MREKYTLLNEVYSLDVALFILTGTALLAFGAIFIWRHWRDLLAMGPSQTEEATSAIPPELIEALRRLADDLARHSGPTGMASSVQLRSAMADATKTLRGLVAKFD